MPKTETMPRAGSFVISLDFELYWGVHDKRSVEQYRENLGGTRAAVERLLDLFDEYGVSATWATVGALFAEDRATARGLAPTPRAFYSDSRLNPWHLLENDSGVDGCHLFAPDWVQAIAERPGHEIATHTFSHAYFLEDGFSAAAKRADLDAAREAAATLGVDLRSIVFPRNQYDAETLRICREAGLECFRGNPISYLYRPRPDAEQSLFVRGLRLADNYVRVTRLHTVANEESGLMNVPATRFLRPYSRSLRRLEPMRLRRLVGEMESLLRRGELFHLWWHPHNFGVFTDENLEVLRVVLDAFVRLREQGLAVSRTMIDEARVVRNHERP